jgi:hypothetical protein
MERKIFRSRISVELIALILVLYMPAVIPMIIYGINLGLYILGGTLLFCAFIFGGIRYVIADDKLYLKMWIIPNGSVKISDILSIERSYNPLSAPAASFKRLCIRFKKGSKKHPYWLISPVREQEFLDILKSINPDIYVRVPAKKKKWSLGDWDI